MALNMEAIGKPIGPIKRDYTWKDVVPYALGVGAGFSELNCGSGICQYVRIQKAHHARPVHPWLCLPGPDCRFGAGPSRAGAQNGLPLLQGPVSGHPHPNIDLEDRPRQGGLANYQCPKR